MLIAPHVFTEAPGLASIAEARRAYETGDLRARLAKYHDDVDSAFCGWNGAWLDPGFKAWNIEDAVGRWRVPALLIQGVDDPYGTLKQIRAIEAGSPALVRERSSSKAAAIRRTPSSRKRRSTPSSGSAPRSRPRPRHADEGKPSAGAGKQSPRKEIKGKNGRKTKGDGRKTKPPSCQVHLYIQ